MLGLAIVLSASALIVYHEFTNDIATAVSLATYIVTCFALMLALVAVGDYVGLKKPQGEANFEYNSSSGELNLVTGEEQLNQDTQDKPNKIKEESRTKEDAKEQ